MRGVIESPNLAHFFVQKVQNDFSVEHHRRFAVRLIANCPARGGLIASFKEKPAMAPSAMKNALVIHRLAQYKRDNGFVFKVFSVSPRLRGEKLRFNQPHRKTPANALLMPRKLGETRIFDKIYQELPPNALVMPIELLC